MPKKKAIVDYTLCQPDKCNNAGICPASRKCEFGSLKQEKAYETPEINPTKWCHSCAKCAKVCPLNAIKMI